MVTIQSNQQLRSSAPPSLGDGSSRPVFDADAAMNAALNYNIDLISKLSDLTLSMGDMNATLQKTMVKNAQSKVEMTRKLLSAQGKCSNAAWFAGVVQRWGDAGTRNAYMAANNGDMKEAFNHFLSDSGLSVLYDDVYNNPNITEADKVGFADKIAGWSDASNGNLSSFILKSSVISQELTQLSNYVADAQSLAESMKPTQIQQAITTLIAQIGQATSMWSSVIAS